MENRYKHRDINWLSFNERVLQEAASQDTPLLERLKFLAIFSSNLDEFFRVRISQLRQLKKVDKALRKKLMTKSNKTLKKILVIVHEQQQLFGTILNSIYDQLEVYGIYFESRQSCSPEQLDHLQLLFKNEILPHCHVIDEFGSQDLKDSQLYLLLSDGEAPISLVYVPVQECGRFIELPGSQEHYIFLEDVLRINLEQLIPGQHIEGSYALKLSRDAELYLEDETTDLALVERIYHSLRKRATGQPTRLLYDAAMTPEVRRALKKRLGISKIDMFPGGKRHNYSDFFSFKPKNDSPELRYPTMPPLPHPELSGTSDFFASLRARDQLVHFPYQDFGVLEAFVAQAASDKDVVSIKISLYRVAENSKLTDALLHALSQGKRVTIFVEAKARFDERNNILWGKTFKEKGARVIFSVPNIKVHAKALLVERLEKGNRALYAYIGTGNFNAKTARIYCDHGLFTADKRITKDLSQVFQTLEQEVIVPKLKYLLVSPYNTRTTFLELIENEISQARSGKVAGITAKMNSLEDKSMMDALYRASETGVRVKLLIRGFSCLINNNLRSKYKIEVISIIDRFLEHGRVYYFENAGQPTMYLGSADWMVRNLDKRIEVLVPILDPDVFKELQEVLQIQFMDTEKARIIDPEDSNRLRKNTGGKSGIRSQFALYELFKQLVYEESHGLKEDR